MKQISLIVVMLSFSLSSFASSICNVWSTRIAYCDGKAMQFDAAAAKAEDPLTAEISVLVNQGYKIASSAGGGGAENPFVVVTLIK